MSKNPRKAVAALGQGSRLRDQAYARIFEIMYERKLPAGALVSQSQLVEMTGVPVAPSAMPFAPLKPRVLTIHPHTGIQFTKPGLELTRSTYQFRGIIEAAAVAACRTPRPPPTPISLPCSSDTGTSSNPLSATASCESNAADLEELEELLHGTIVARSQ